MTSENTTVEKKPKNPKRVAAGKKGVEARKLKAELKRKEEEAMKKENIKLRAISESPIQITKDDRASEVSGSHDEVKTMKKDITKDAEVKETLNVNIYKNYIPLCLIGVIGIGLYMFNSKQQTVTQTVTQPVTEAKLPAPSIQPMKQMKEIDPFEFN